MILHMKQGLVLTVYIMTAHWAYVIPLCIGVLDKVNERWGLGMLSPY